MTYWLVQQRNEMSLLCLYIHNKNIFCEENFKSSAFCLFEIYKYIKHMK